MKPGIEYKQRLRGVILELVAKNHELQKHRHDDYTLLKTLTMLGFEAHLNLVRELVQDLGERGCLKFEEYKDLRSGEVRISKIQILPRGRNILEREESDPGIQLDVE